MAPTWKTGYGATGAPVWRREFTGTLMETQLPMVGGLSAGVGRFGRFVTLVLRS